MAFPGAFPQGINPWYVGQLSPGWATQLLYDDSTPQKLNPVNLTGLTGSNITLLIQPVDANGNNAGSPSTGAGTISITDAPNGKITYPPNAADVFVTTVGYVALQWKVAMPGNLPWFSDPFILQTKAVE
jgi:hypothetical protein